MRKKVVELDNEACSSAAAIQYAIDQLPEQGGVLQLPALDLTLDRGLELRSAVELRGCGEQTVLRKAASRVYPLTGYHNYGMCDVPLNSTEGLEVGMTVSIHDDHRRGFYSTLARITWIDGDWVGIDHGIEADYDAADNPRLTTAHPLIFGHSIHNAAVRDLALDGNLAENPVAMDGCRGGAVYFAKSSDIEVTGVTEKNYSGEGISFQMCMRMVIRNSSFSGNTGNGLHPGAGSTDVLFENCRGNENRHGGFFFCVRANHVTVRNCAFAGNTGPGMSVGARDCYNLIEHCDFSDNKGPGILIRQTPAPIEVHSCIFRQCRLVNNASESLAGQVRIEGDAHDLIIEDSTFVGDTIPPVTTAGDVGNIFLNNNRYANDGDAPEGDPFISARPEFECGHESCRPQHCRHL